MCDTGTFVPVDNGLIRPYMWWLETVKIRNHSCTFLNNVHLCLWMCVWGLQSSIQKIENDNHNTWTKSPPPLRAMSSVTLVFMRTKWTKLTWNWFFFLLSNLSLHDMYKITVRVIEKFTVKVIDKSSLSKAFIHVQCHGHTHFPIMTWRYMESLLHLVLRIKYVGFNTQMVRWTYFLINRESKKTLFTINLSNIISTLAFSWIFIHVNVNTCLKICIFSKIRMKLFPLIFEG